MSNDRKTRKTLLNALPLYRPAIDYISMIVPENLLIEILESQAC